MTDGKAVSNSRRGRVVSPEDVARDRVLTKPGRWVVDRAREYIKVDIAWQSVITIRKIIIML